MRQLSIKEIALYGFGATFVIFVATIITTLLYLAKIESLEKKSDFYVKAYDSLFEFKYYTERLLTTYDLKEETTLWLQSKNNFSTYFQVVEEENREDDDFINFWNVIENESKIIELKLQNRLFEKQNTQERSLLRRLGEGLNDNKHSDYYIALVDLKNSIDYIKQYEIFLLDVLKEITVKKQEEIFQKIETAKDTGIAFVMVLIVLSISILLYVVRLIAKVESRLHTSNIDKDKLNEILIENYTKTLYALVNMIEERDTYTGGHSQRVAKYSVLIAQAMGYNEEDLERVYQAGMLHDIGKMNIPDSILLKPSKLDALEYQVIQTHAENGYKFLKQIPMYAELADIIHYHHEYFNHKGYPTNRGSDDVPIFSYILSVADAFDAMTTNRIYQGRKNVQEALEEIQRCSNEQFHPEVSDVAMKVLRNITIDKNIHQTPINVIEMERFSYFYKDQVSHMYNEHYLEFVLNRNCITDEYSYVYIFFMKNFTQYNNKYGWQKGNEMIYEFSHYLRDFFQDGIVFRVDGDDFIVLHKQKSTIDTLFYEKLNIIEGSDIVIEHKFLEIKNKNICTYKALHLLLHERG